MLALSLLGANSTVYVQSPNRDNERCIIVNVTRRPKAASNPEPEKKVMRSLKCIMHSPPLQSAHLCEAASNNTLKDVSVLERSWRKSVSTTS